MGTGTSHPCEEMTLREDVLAAQGKPPFSHCPVSFFNFANSWMVSCARAMGKFLCRCRENL